ncbi:hypothetical protein C8D92_106194 [Tamilnaduibacter salinus]|uniref:Lipoprotein n=1 Tax=Tamilnaduibacter salinus TaxID=1484056 RepID=A0A2A2I596_9GAMM|nr:hypothetical protein [Tamilnaduibacter salinus]PAV26827.1 hypothetical protein CF392_03895 [Tamilnaduibacter salinus]PVY75933.1 hypothetical protein C8D92_106194 [Tamilnaduibacter salinus]
MKKGLIVSSLLLAGALTGCSSLNTSSNPMPLAGNVQTDINADIEVGEKISGSSSATKILFFTMSSDSEYADGVVYGAPNGNGGGSLLPFNLDPTASVKSAAAYNAIEASGADVIVAPQYTVKKKDFGVYGTIDVTVEGYKGTINSIE